jgi:glyoxylase I family protein
MNYCWTAATASALVLIVCGLLARADDGSKSATSAPVVPGVRVWGVRYQVKDIERAVAFYTHTLGFKLDHRQANAFAKVSIDGLGILLSGPGSSGSRPMPDGRRQEPGGWNRIVLRVEDLPARIEQLRAAGVRFRNAMEAGPGGNQIQIEDPDGNAIELFEPAPAQR